MAGLTLICALAFRAGAQDFKSERQLTKARHKAEQNALKMKQKFAKDSPQRQEGPKAQRLLVKHQMERERRELRERQKDEIQDLKDRQKVLEENQKRL
jgi:biopolymer transport protein ExbB/TolQ